MFKQIPVTKVELELTEACNLQCRFCYNSCEPAYCRNAHTIIDQLERGGVLELVLTGGEPSEHPDFFNILRYACERIPRVMVQSNGVNFGRREYFEQLAAEPVACVNFSLHGLKHTHENLTQIRGSFEATVQAIRWCLAAGVRVASNMVLTAINSNDTSIKELVSLHASLGMREMTVTRFI
ncbi:MAG: radical SAM protein, partial [Desulfosporosinus sp.]